MKLTSRELALLVTVFPTSTGCHCSFSYMAYVKGSFSWHLLKLFLNYVQVGTGLVCCVFKPHSPATVPNPANVFENAVATECDYIFIAPTFIEVSDF